MSQFFVDFRIPQPLTQEFVSLIPAHRARVNELMSQGKILSYSLAMDRSRVWAVVQAASVEDAESIADSLPLSPYMHWDVHELMFHNSVQLALPAMSMN